MDSDRKRPRRDAMQTGAVGHALVWVGPVQLNLGGLGGQRRRRQWGSDTEFAPGWWPTVSSKLDPGITSGRHRCLRLCVKYALN